jgi:hypothetical protein
LALKGRKNTMIYTDEECAALDKRTELVKTILKNMTDQQVENVSASPCLLGIPVKSRGRFRNIEFILTNHPDNVELAILSSSWNMSERKRRMVLLGNTAVMSDQELDAWIDDGMPCDVVSMPNPDQVGTLDPWVVGLKGHPVMRKARMELYLEFHLRFSSRD